MRPIPHGVRIALLMGAVAALLGWLAAHAEIMFADGLRYIRQAQSLDHGALRDGLRRAVDHPLYAMAIATLHHEMGDEGPVAWQHAAQGASILAGVLLVIPLYLVAWELFGARSAWLGVVLTFAVPLTGHVLADTLSESTFLLFWTWGLWCALRFLREGVFAWLPVTTAFAALAYLTRPEGLLLPAALVATLALMPLLRPARMNWPRWWSAVGFLVIGPCCLVGPYVAMKGGLGTKPAIARLLGTAPKSASDAVERERPLEPGQTILKTYAIAAKSVWQAIRDAVTLPLLPLALLGLWTCRPFSPRFRVWLLVGIIAVAATLALIRLHATGGYCSPRHAMVLALLIIPAAGAGLDHLLRAMSIPGRWVGMGQERLTAGPLVWLLAIAALMIWNRAEFVAPINSSIAGYRPAGEWLAQHLTPKKESVVDVSGLALYYGASPGYTFANLVAAPGDPKLRWVITRESHLVGPWWYCGHLRSLVAGREPVKVFPESPRPGQARILVFDRNAPTSVASRPGASGAQAR